jgi:hypothetical protein
MKKKSAIIGAMIITLVFSLSMGIIGVSAFTNTNGVAVSNSPSTVSASITTGSTGTSQSSQTTGGNTRTRHHETNEFGNFGVRE